MSSRVPADGGWNPYLAGALSGLVAILSVALTGKFFGASTTFVRTAGLIEGFFAPARVAQMELFRRETPMIDWQWVFVVGILLGALLSSWSDGSFRWQAVPNMWAARFGPAKGPRAAAAFLGGLVAIIGARLAGGCPSGHGLTGVMQLALSGFVALICFFLGGLIVARLLYGPRRSA
ncbi:MAG: YeeE/YedE thiosulfate transporter family protein [Desulfobacca sp.]|uniref:YeeE/YedE thiosulfate transporter family protein n=1 Tax=Desulfobacca sp. TaxID=2067990 RepID=UPI00404A5076